MRGRSQWLRIILGLGLWVLVVVWVLGHLPARGSTDRSTRLAAKPAPGSPVPGLHAPTAGLARTWEPTGFQGEIVRALAVDDGRAGGVFAGTDTGVYRWDSALRWRHVLQTSGVTSILVLSGGRSVLAAGQAGVYVSRDHGTRWRLRPVPSRGVFALTVQPGNPRHLVAGGGDGLYLSLDAGRHWTRRLPMRHIIADSLSWQPGSRRVAFAATTDADQSGGRTGVLITRDAGWTWHPFGTNSISAPGVMAVLATRQAIFAGSMGHGVWRAHLEAPAWRLLPHGMPSFSGIRAFEVHGAAFAIVPSRRPTLYVGTIGHGVYGTTDGGNHWTVVSRGLLAARYANVVLALAYDPRRHALYAGTDDGVYELDKVS